MSEEVAKTFEGMPAEMVQRTAEIRTLSATLLDRLNYLRQAGISFNGQRDLYEVLGYDRVLTYSKFRSRYERGGIAKRIIEAYPRATWRSGVELYEDEDPKNKTAFEQAWEDLEKRLGIWSMLQRADILAGLSTFSVLLIGAPGDLATELPKGTPEKLMYLMPFSGGGGYGGDRIGRPMTMDADASVFEFETDMENPRFGLPKIYQLRRTMLASPQLQRPVHWTRVIHIAEGCLGDDVYGQPTLESIWNLLDDLDKVTGGGAEAFWLRANPGMHMNIDKDMTLPAQKAGEKSPQDQLKEQADAYSNQITRWIRTKGVEITPLSATVSDFNNAGDAILTQIAGTKGIPKRILMGSEMGQLASGQDADNWASQVDDRRSSYAAPNIVRRLVDRLVEYGYLPTPKQYDVGWPTTRSLSEIDKARGAQLWANVNRTQGEIVYTNDEIREKWSELEPLKPEQKQPIAAPVRVVGTETNAGDVTATGISQPSKADVAAPKTLTAGPHSFASTQVQLPPELADALLDLGRQIPDAVITADGRETDPHVTVKYGIHSDDVAPIWTLLNGWGALFLTFGKTDYFSTPEYDVVYVEVRSPDLMEMNAAIRQTVPVTDTQPVYVPHATIAYVLSGTGAAYKGLTALAGQTATIDTVRFSPSYGPPTDISLQADVADDITRTIVTLETAIRDGDTATIDRLIGLQHTKNIEPIKALTRRVERIVRDQRGLISERIVEEEPV